MWQNELGGGGNGSTTRLQLWLSLVTGYNIKWCNCQRDIQKHPSYIRRDTRSWLETLYSRWRSNQGLTHGPDELYLVYAGTFPPTSTGSSSSMNFPSDCESSSEVDRCLEDCLDVLMWATSAIVCLPSVLAGTSSLKHDSQAHLLPWHGQNCTRI